MSSEELQQMEAEVKEGVEGVGAPAETAVRSPEEVVTVAEPAPEAAAPQEQV